MLRSIGPCLLAALFCIGCNGTATKPAPDTGKKKPPVVGDVAVMGTAAGLVQVAPDGTQTRLSDDAVKWCRVDTRLDAVWFTSATADDGKVALKLLPRGKSAAIQVAAGLPETGTVIVDHGPGKSLGRISEVKYQVVPALNLAAPDGPKLAHVVGCDGDQGHMCYEDEAAKTLNAELVKLAASIDAVKVAGAEAVNALVASAGGRVLNSDAKKDLDPVPVAGVPTGECEIPDMCGIGVKLPGSPFLLVAVHNERGDFFHEFLQVYDPRTKEFLHPQDPTKRAAMPFKGKDGMLTVYDGFASNTGAIVALDDGVASLERGMLFKAQEGHACGFWQIGGQRIEAGP